MATKKEPSAKVGGPASYFPSIEKTYGRPIAEWQTIIRANPGLKHMELVALLKTQHAMGHGHAGTASGLAARWERWGWWPSPKCDKVIFTGGAHFSDTTEASQMAARARRSWCLQFPESCANVIADPQCRFLDHSGSRRRPRWARSGAWRATGC
jgi:hypothetical protein